MKHHQSSGLNDGLNLLIDPLWSPEQAMAVIELLDDLRERIWTHYELALLAAFGAARVSHHDVQTSEPPF